MAEPNDPKDPKDPQDPKDPKDPKGSEKSYKTQEEFDQAFAARLERERKKLEKDFEDKLKHERTEAERLAKLNDDERKTEEQRKREEDLERRERETTLREMRLQARDMLLDKGISDTLVDMVVDVDADKTKSNIDKLATVFNKAVEEQVKEKLKGETPKDPSGQKPSGTTNKKTGTVAF